MFVSTGLLKVARLLKSVCLYLRWWEEIRRSRLQESQSPMGQLWCEHTTERKPSAKNSMAKG